MRLINNLKDFLFSKERWKIRLVKADYHLGRPIVLAGILIMAMLILAVVFAIDNQKLLRQTKNAADSAKISADNSVIIVGQVKKVLCEDIPDDQCNLSKAVDELKEDNKRSDRLIACLLALHGANIQIDIKVQAQCEKMSNGVAMEDITRSDDNSPPASPEPPTTSEGQGEPDKKPETANQEPPANGSSNGNNGLNIIDLLNMLLNGALR